MRGLDIDQSSVLEPLLRILALESVVVGHKLERYALGVCHLKGCFLAGPLFSWSLMALFVGGGVIVRVLSVSMMLTVGVSVLSMSMMVSVCMAVAVVMVMMMEGLAAGLVLKVKNDQPSVVLQQLASKCLDGTLGVIDMVQDKVGKDQIESFALGEVLGRLGFGKGGLCGDKVVDGRDLGLDRGQFRLGGEPLVQAVKHPLGSVDADHVVDGSSDGLAAQADANTEIKGDGVLEAFITGGLAELVDDGIAGLCRHLKDVGYLFVVDGGLVEVLVVDLLHRLGGHLEREVAFF